MKISIARVVAVTFGLSLVGAVCGAVLGGLAGLVMFDIPSHPPNLDAWPLVAASGSLFGAVFGFVLVPIIGWIFLRRISLGRAILQTAAGVLAGLLVSAVVEPGAAILFGLGGFVLASGVLWLTTCSATRNRRTPV